MTMIFGYWNVRGWIDWHPPLNRDVAIKLAQPIRLLLEYTGTSYEYKQYVFGPGPDYDSSHWLKEKETLGLDFPNLPYLIDGNVKLTQSNAILRYIGRKHNLCGESETEISRVDVLVSQVMDFRIGLANISYNPNFESLKGPYLEQLPDKLKRFSQYLGKRKWFAGEKITIADFLMYDVLDQHRMLEATCLDSFPNLKTFMQQFEALEKIDAYMKSSRFIKTPIYSPMAKWCNEK